MIDSVDAGAFVEPSHIMFWNAMVFAQAAKIHFAGGMSVNVDESWYQAKIFSVHHDVAVSVIVWAVNGNFIVFKTPISAV